MKQLKSSDLEVYKQSLEDIEGIAEKIKKRINEIIIIVHDAFGAPYPIHWSYRDRYECSNNAVSDFLPTFDDEVISYDVTYANDWPDMNTNDFNYLGAIPYDFLFRSNSDVRFIIDAEIIAQKKYEINETLEKHKAKEEDEKIKAAALAKLSSAERAALGYE